MQTTISLSRIKEGKDNTVADFLSRMKDRLTEEEADVQFTKIPLPGVRAVLDDAQIDIAECAESAIACAETGIDIPPAQAQVAKVLVACPARLSTLHVNDWKRAQKDDPVLFAIVKHLKAPRHEFKRALKYVTDEKSARAYLKSRDNLVMRGGLLYHKLKLRTTGEVVWHFMVPKVY